MRNQDIAVGKGRCKQTIIEDGIVQFIEGNSYELIQYSSEEIQGRTEEGLYLTVSDSGS